MDTPIPAATPAPAPQKTRNIPQDQDEKADLAVRLAQAWKLNPQLVFIWTTQAAYEVVALAYQKSILDKAAVDVLRPAITLSMQEADAKIAEGLPYLKAALLTRFKKGKDKAMYPQFGIISHNKGFELPHGQTERRDALALLVAALATYDIKDDDYGSSFWEPIEAAYREAARDAKKHESATGTLKGTKDTLETQVDKVLSKMLVLLEAQYDEAELPAKRREMGYLKEYN
ncbi:MAG: hypothetical protein JWP58_3058 [Hymenobacter sp.]|nr:hypothetical protein [Hymenobacter sp.]